MRIIIVVLFAGIIGLVAKAFMPSGVQPDTKPEFQFEKESHDFGKIAAGKSVSVDFKYVNAGTDPLIISSVESSGNNTVPKFSTAPVKKGGSGIVSVTFNAGTQAQPFIKTITIHSNAKTPTKVLYIKGEVVSAGSSAM